MKRVLILSENDDCADPSRLPLSDYDSVALAFWSSPEFVERVKRAGAKECWRLNDFVPDYAALVCRAYFVGHAVAERAPQYRGVNPLQAWENTLANALLTPLIAAQILNGLRERQPDLGEICFLSQSDTQRAFEIVSQNSFPSPRLRVLNEREATKRHHANGRLGAWLLLAREAQRDRDWAQVAWVPVEVLDRRYVWRQRLWRHSSFSRGGIFFYSSYVNYSRTLAKHAAHFDSLPQWIVNNHSARLGLPNGARWHHLWQFGAGIRDTATFLQVLRAAVNQSPERADGLPLRAILQSNAEVQEVLFRTLPLVLAEIDLMDAAIQELQPDSVWVANQWGSEGALIQAARYRRIPVTQVQHGALEQYYDCAPIYSDRLLVWGEFWKRAVNGAEQSKVQVVNPGFEVSAKAVRSNRGESMPRVTFFTAPANVVLFWNPSVVLWETVALLDELTTRRHSMTVRVHPADQIDKYRQAWIKHCGRLPDGVSFEKGGSLEPVLAKTDVALMAFSTVFLNCLASGIPVVGLGWYPFMWQAQLQEGGYIRFANSLGKVKCLTDLPPSPASNWEHLIE